MCGKFPFEYILIRHLTDYAKCLTFWPAMICMANFQDWGVYNLLGSLNILNQTWISLSKTFLIFFFK